MNSIFFLICRGKSIIQTYKIGSLDFAPKIKLHEYLIFEKYLLHKQPLIVILILIPAYFENK